MNTANGADRATDKKSLRRTNGTGQGQGRPRTKRPSKDGFSARLLLIISGTDRSRAKTELETGLLPVSPNRRGQEALPSSTVCLSGAGERVGCFENLFSGNTNRADRSNLTHLPLISETTPHRRHFNCLRSTFFPPNSKSDLPEVWNRPHCATAFNMGDLCCERDRRRV